MHTKGRKWQNLKILSGKNRLQELQPGFLWEFGLAQTHGDTKYAPGNWKDGAHHREEYLGAIFRHFLRYMSGQENDPETGLHHMAHLACSAMYLYYFDRDNIIDIRRKCHCEYCNNEEK